MEETTPEVELALPYLRQTLELNKPQPPASQHRLIVNSPNSCEQTQGPPNPLKRMATNAPNQPGPRPLPPSPILEIPLFTGSSLLPAVSAGCRRVELNAPGSYAAGGTTPPAALVREVSRDLRGLPFRVPLRVMLRPRGGDFVYSAGERRRIRDSVVEIKGLLEEGRGDGFVFGALLPAGQGQGEGEGRWCVHVRLCAEVLEWARPFPVVFHRACDEWPGGGPVALIGELGFMGLLTSGGPGTARGNLAVLRGIIERSCGLMEVIVGGGVRSANVRDIYDELKDVEGARVVYHSSCLSDPENSEEVDVEEVRRIVRTLGG